MICLRSSGNTLFITNWSRLFFGRIIGRTELGGILEGVNNSCRLLDLQRYHRVLFFVFLRNEKPSSILLLYTILVLSQIRSEETLITYLKKWDHTDCLQADFINSRISRSISISLSACSRFYSAYLPKVVPCFPQRKFARQPMRR